jgi:hypothetical protein
MRRSEISSIKDLLKQAVDENRLNDGLDKVKVKRIWAEVVGKFATNATTDIYVSGSKLFVQINSSIIRSELMLIKSDLIKMINKEIGRNFIKDLIIR